MTNNINNNTRFKSLIRIDPNQLQWIKSSKDTKTLAGYLDKIINYYKKHASV
jgi:hypothetical protein